MDLKTYWIDYINTFGKQAKEAKHELWELKLPVCHRLGRRETERERGRDLSVFEIMEKKRLSLRERGREGAKVSDR